MIPVFPEQLTAASEEAGWEVIYNQLGRGVMHGEFLQAEGKNLVVAREKYTHAIHGIGSAAPDNLAFLIQLNKSPGRFNGVSTCQSEAFVLSPRVEFDYFANQGQDFLTIQVNQASFIENIKKLRASNGTEPDFSKWSCIRMPQHILGPLGNHIGQFLHQVPFLETVAVDSSREVNEDSILQLLSLLFLDDTVDGKSPFQPDKSKRSKSVDLATDFIHHNLGGALTIPEICEAADCSLRTLEYGFRERYDLTPALFIKMHRMNRARRELLGASPDEATVAKVVRSCGINHHSRFSMEYREMFGERPSETLHSS